VLHWTLVFTTTSLEHLAKREVAAQDVADAVFGAHGPVRVRRTGRGARERWFIVAPVTGGELLTCVLRAAEPRDLDAEGAFSLPRAAAAGIRRGFDGSMKLCVTAWMSQQDELRSYRNWRREKGGLR
jgi:hypothetical protein